MRQEYALDALADHPVVPADPSREVPNPAWGTVDAQLRQAQTHLAPKRKHLTNLIKMVAYQAESDLLRWVASHYQRGMEAPCAVGLPGQRVQGQSVSVES